MSEALHEEEALGKAYDARLMRRLLGYVRPYRGRVGVAVGVLLLGSMLELVGPWLTMIALDRAIPARDFGQLTTLAVIFVVALVLAFLLEYVQTLLTVSLGQGVMYDLRREIFARLQRLSVSFFDRNPVGRLMTRVTSDVEVLNELFSAGVVTVFGDVFTLVLIVVAMFVMDWRLALVTLAVMPFVVLTAGVFRTRIRGSFRDIRVRLARLNAFLQERISGVAVLRLFGQEERTVRRFREIDARYLEAHLRSVTYYALFFPIIELLTAVAFALIVFYGGTRVLGGVATVGTIAAFLQLARRFFRPIQDISDKYNMLQGAMASSERVFKLLDTEAPAGDAEAPLHLPLPGRGEIEFRDVWFAYPGSASLGSGSAALGSGSAPAAPGPAKPSGAEPDYVLKGVSFRARAGERVAIVGHTGAGKTTILSLLMRYYEPQRGEILLDGVPIRRVPLEELRDRIGLVLQDVFLFSRDVAYNLRLGRDDITDERLRRAAADVGADRVVARLPHGLGEPLGERGGSLSVGERQLLSFARALAFDPLVLVLDEATSSVDSELEARIEEAVETLMRGRTAIVVAHRLSTVRSADRILVLHHGELREQGTHQELLARGGLYARLHELQFAPRAAAPLEAVR